MLECKVCGTKFNAIIERHYLARDNGKIGLAVAFSSTTEEGLYDAFDCPMCGCQVIAKERKREYTLCDWIERLPYSELITGKEEKADV